MTDISVQGIMSQFLSGEVPGSTTTPPPDGVTPEPIVTASESTEVPPAEAVIPATPETVTPEPEVEEPPANGPIAEVRAWGKREHAQKQQLKSELTEIKGKYDAVAPIAEKIEGYGGPDVVEHAFSGLQKMRDPRFVSEDVNARAEATVDLLKHFQETDPENYAAFDKHLHSGYQLRIEDQMAREYFGVTLDRVTPEMVAQMQAVGRQISAGTFVAGGVMPEPTKALPQGQRPDYCYYWNIDEMTGQQTKGELNPQAAADYDARIRLQQDLDAIKKSQSDSRTEAEKRAAESRTRELETKRETYFNDAIQPITDHLSKVFAPVASDTTEVRTQKDFLRDVLLNGLKETIRRSPETAAIYSEMNMNLGRSGKVAEIDANNRKNSLSFKARGLLARVTPAINSFLTATGAPMKETINRIESAGSEAPKTVVTGDIPPEPNPYDQTVFPGGPFSAQYLMAKQDWNQKYGHGGRRSA